MRAVWKVGTVVIAAAVYRVIYSPFVADQSPWLVIDDARCRVISKHATWAVADQSARRKNVMLLAKWRERAVQSRTAR